jgi:hypothetical protein
LIIFLLLLIVGATVSSGKRPQILDITARIQQLTHPS